MTTVEILAGLVAYFYNQIATDDSVAGKYMKTLPTKLFDV